MEEVHCTGYSECNNATAPSEQSRMVSPLKQFTVVSGCLSSVVQGTLCSLWELTFDVEKAKEVVVHILKICGYYC